jgi:hypothetical protein
MICNSGGAPGSDMVFEKECVDNGIEIIAWSFANHHTDSKFRKILTQEELKEGWEHAVIANQTLKRNVNFLSPYVKNLLSRNWFQVKNSDAVFAIGVIQKENWNIVNGGTGWAVQMAIDSNKPLYVFDQEKGYWFVYSLIKDQDNNDRGTFLTNKDSIFLPKLTENFAGVGTREINDNGIKAIKDLLKNKK